MSAIIVDTSIWIEFFRGTALPALENALADGVVVLSPMVVSELLSAPLGRRQRDELKQFLNDLPLHPTSFNHWVEVGQLRAQLGKAGLTVSTPDAHVAQCALDLGCFVWSRDKIFERIARKTSLRVYPDLSQPAKK